MTKSQSPPAAATITFASDLAGQTITLTSGVLAIDDNLTIDGLGANELSVSGDGSSEVFSVASGATVTISGLTIADGFASSGDGGGISNAGTLTLQSCTVTGNVASGLIYTYGGGIFNTGNLTLQSCAVTGNVALGTYYTYGGGICNAGNLILDQSDVTGNQVDGGAGIAYGGGIVNQTGATLTLNDTTVSDNQAVEPTASNQGGGIDNQAGATLSLTDSTISGNQAIGESVPFGESAIGGGILDSGALTITDSLIDDNQAAGGSNAFFGGSGYGGGMYVETIFGSDQPGPATLTMTGSTVTNNLAAGGADSAGGFRGRLRRWRRPVLVRRNVSLTGCTVSDNKAAGGDNSGDAYGGGLWSESSTISIIGVRLLLTSRREAQAPPVRLS